MKNNKTALATLLSIFFMFVSAPVNATVTPIDLNNFFSDPTVSDALDGSTATMAEDEFMTPVILSNDPGLGDPNVIIPSAGALLKFEYAFEEGLDNDDEFFAAVLDDFGLAIAGFEFFTDASGAGTVTFDLSSLVGPFFGLQFELRSYEFAFDPQIHLASVARISNVRIETPDVDMPLPPMAGLVLLGLFWLKNTRRKSMVG